MGRKPDESSADFKKRILDQISPSYCAAKWYNATIWLGSGQTASCHHPPPHKIRLSEISENPTAIHNTLHKKLMRSQMLRGERPRECEYCWRIEDMDRNNSSDRIFKSDFYDDKDLLGVKEKGWDANVQLRTLEIAFDRICNFACSYCNAGYSTRWAADINKNGAYQDLQSDGRGAFMHNGAWADPFEEKESNPYVDAFWKWWPELEQTLIELKITGGEPLMSPQLWKLFDYFENRQSRPEFLFSFNSNLGLPHERIQKMIQKTKNIANLGIYTSMEAVGAQAEYIRDGLDYKLWQKNVESVLSGCKLNRFVIMATINALSLYSLPEFLDYCLELKAKHGPYFPTVSLTILRFPSFMSPSVLPNELKQERRQALQNWLDKNRENPLFVPTERETLQRLIDYLEVVETPHHRTSEIGQRISDFKAFYSQYDKRRGKNFSKVFPKPLVDWYESIPLYNSNKLEPLMSGDASEGYHNQEDLKKLAKREKVEW